MSKELSLLLIAFAHALVLSLLAVDHPALPRGLHDADIEREGVLTEGSIVVKDNKVFVHSANGVDQLLSSVNSPSAVVVVDLQHER